MRLRLLSTSKMPPENLEPALQLRHAFSQGTDFHGGGVYTILMGNPSGDCATLDSSGRA